MTPAITQKRNKIIITSTIGLTCVAAPPLGTNVFHAWASAAGNRATIPMVIINEMPFPMPRSVI